MPSSSVGFIPGTGIIRTVSCPSPTELLIQRADQPTAWADPASAHSPFIEAEWEVPYGNGIPDVLQKIEAWDSSGANVPQMLQVTGLPVADAYGGTDILVIAFDTTNQHTLDNVAWLGLPDWQQHSRIQPSGLNGNHRVSAIVLVGTQLGKTEHAR